MYNQSQQLSLQKTEVRKQQEGSASGTHKGISVLENFISGKNVVVYSLVLAAVFLLLVFYIGQTMQITHLNYQIDHLEEKLEKVHNKNHKLSIKLSHNTSLSHIEKYARRQLQMKEPAEVKVVVMNNNHRNTDKKQYNQLASSARSSRRVFLLQVFNNIFQGLNTVKAISAD